MTVTSLDDLKILQLVDQTSDEVWSILKTWDSFARRSIGIQWVRSVDSIGANIAEAYGRYHYGEKIQFRYYARGSVFESKYWLNRSLSRELINEKTGSDLHRRRNYLFRFNLQ